MKLNLEMRGVVGVDGNPDYEDLAICPTAGVAASRELTFLETQIIQSIERGNIDQLAAYLKPPRQSIHSDVLSAFLKVPMRLIFGRIRGGAAARARPMGDGLMESIKNQVVLAMLLGAAERKFLDELYGFCRGGLRHESGALLPVRIELKPTRARRGRPSLPHEEIAAIIAYDQAVRRNLYRAGHGSLNGAPEIAKRLGISRSTVYNIWDTWHEVALADLVVKAKGVLAHSGRSRSERAVARHIIDWNNKRLPKGWDS